MPRTVMPQKAELTYLDKRLMCELRNGLVLHMGLVKADTPLARTPPEFLEFSSGTATVAASLIRVTPRLVYYRQVMKPGKANHEGNDRINDQQQ